MKEYQLSFCNIQHRDDDIVVLEINDGINVDAKMSREIIELADRTLTHPVAIISNRKNSYSLSFEAITALARYPNIAALAIVVYSPKTELLVKTQNLFLSTITKMPVKTFTSMASAINWLDHEFHHSAFAH
jgi:hypothetical protein